MRVAGIMTGTSVDAIDIAVCDISTEGDRHAISLVSFSSAPFEEDLRQGILAAMAGESTMQELSDIPFLLARAVAAAVSDHHARYGSVPEFYAVHGQTLWHHPPLSTWQSLSGPALSALLGAPVIHDFRSADVAVGGQGAPLVPIYDHAVYRAEHDVVALNIGGMANMTILRAGASVGQILAFDTGPGNVWIDGAARVTFGKGFDANGAIARSGRVIPPMLDEMRTIGYFSADPPKSTGRERFTINELRRLVTKYSHPSAPLEDVVTTVTELTAWSVVDHLQRYAPTTHEVIVSGGGSQNSFLVERIEALSRSADNGWSIRVDLQWAEKEAMAFAYLGWLTWQGLPGNVPSVTGAQRPVVLGTIARA